MAIFIHGKCTDTPQETAVAEDQELITTGSRLGTALLVVGGAGLLGGGAAKLVSWINTRRFKAKYKNFFEEESV